MKEVLDATVGMIFGVTPSQMSLLYFLHYVHCAGGFSFIVNADEKGYAQEWRIKVKMNTIASRRNVWKLRRHRGRVVSASICNLAVPGSSPALGPVSRKSR